MQEWGLQNNDSAHCYNILMGTYVVLPMTYEVCQLFLSHVALVVSCSLVCEHMERYGGAEEYSEHLSAVVALDESSQQALLLAQAILNAHTGRTHLDTLVP